MSLSRHKHWSRIVQATSPDSSMARVRDFKPIYGKGLVVVDGIYSASGG